MRNAHILRYSIVILAIVMLVLALLRRRDTEPPPEILSFDAAPVKKQPWQAEIDLDHAHFDTVGNLTQVFHDGSQANYSLDELLQGKAKTILAEYTLPYGAIAALDIDSMSWLVLAAHSESEPLLPSSKLLIDPWSPSASLFKTITASALVEQHVDTSKKVCYTSAIRKLELIHLEDTPAKNANCQNLNDAVAHSNNAVLAKLAVKHLNQEIITDTAQRLGYGKKPEGKDIGLYEKLSKSIISVPQAKLEFARMAAGFWHSKLSPTHAATIASTFARNGKFQWPRLVTRYIDINNVEHMPLPFESYEALTSDTAQNIRKMLETTVKSGTARKAFFTRRGAAYLPGISVAGKTGSLAQASPEIHFSLFMGYAPAEEPKIAFAVVLGNPVSWRIKASTAARLFLQYYFFEYKRALAAAARATKSKSTTPEHVDK